MALYYFLAGLVMGILIGICLTVVISSIIISKENERKIEEDYLKHEKRLDSINEFNELSEIEITRSNSYDS